MSEFKDLGLSYEEAAHGVQTAIAFSIEMGGKSTEPKHMRTGIDISKAEQAGIAHLLISKGIFTIDEYMETMRLAANTELFMHEKKAKSRGIDINFR
jgi:hypothetical protein